LEKPQELAEEILRGTDWDRSRIEATIAQYPGQVPEKSTTIGLKNKLPVYLMYMTSSVKEDGIIRFHPDYYGMNALMLNKLDQVKNEI
jgi:murein L,D-transpeptidase YcbB/YkuD